jgi:adenosylcobinamide-phosphate synthase
MNSRGGVLALAVLLDLLLGEAPAGLHPVVWMGSALSRLERLAPSGEGPRMAFGSVVAVALPAAWAVLAWAVGRRLPPIGQAVLLKPTFAGAALLAAGASVEGALRAERLPEARQALGALVSRATSGLDTELASSAAIESLAENFVDSWLAPHLMYALGGLPLAYAYRAVNTADAMWGYRDARYEHLGNAVARLDDACNWLPARLGALLLALVSGAPVRSLAVCRRDASQTASPNAGQVMAAAAGALDVRLEKVDHYVLHAEARTPTPSDIARARRLIGRGMLLSAAMCAVARA